MNPAAPHSGTPGAAHVKRSVPGTYSPAPHHPNRANAEGYDGYPSKPMDCAGWAKMRVHAGAQGGSRKGCIEGTQQSKAVTFSEIGRDCLPRTSSVAHWPDERAGPLLFAAGRPNTHSLPSMSLFSQALDEAGPEAARILLRDNLRAFFPRSGSRILPQPVDARQSLPSRCANLNKSFRLRFICHVQQHGSGALKCPTNPLNGLSR